MQDKPIKIGFRYVSPDGDADWWNLDNIMVKSLMQNEVDLYEFIFLEYGLIGDTYSFEGVLPWRCWNGIL